MPVTSVTHRGIRWQRDSQGRLRWWNDDKDGWVRYHAGDDAPPRPPGWEPASSAAPPPLTRPKWRSPYRIVPIVLAVVILVVGLIQAFHSGSTTSSASEAKAAGAFLGQCLPKVSSAADAGYSSTTVACTSPRAAGKVVAVVTYEQGHGACPAGTVAAVLTSEVVSQPHLECIRPLPGG